MQLRDLIQQAELEGMPFLEQLDAPIEIDINDVKAVSGEVRSIDTVTTSYGSLRLKLV